MLGLKLPTDPNWSNIAEKNIEEVLTDHAWCEQKAVSNAISLIVYAPEHVDLVNQCLCIAEEELLHFKQVNEIIQKRGFILGRERKDEYVNELYSFMRKGMQRHIVLVDRLLFSALIEARSCERFKILSESIKDKELASFYKALMISEAGHYTTFLKLAKQYANGLDVSKRWEEFLAFESEVIQRYGKKETMHG